MMEEKEAWVWLNMQAGIGSSRLVKAIADFGSAAAFLDDCVHSSRSDHQARWRERLSRSVGQWREEARAELDRAAQADVKVLTLEDSGYPEPLRCLDDAPQVLYLSGSYQPEDKAALALVGSRRPSSYGLMVAAEFTRTLAEWG